MHFWKLLATIAVKYHLLRNNTNQDRESVDVLLSPKLNHRNLQTKDDISSRVEKDPLSNQQIQSVEKDSNATLNSILKSIQSKNDCKDISVEATRRPQIRLQDVIPNDISYFRVNDTWHSKNPGNYFMVKCIMLQENAKLRETYVFHTQWEF